MLTTWFMPAPSLPSESRMRSNVVRTSCSNVTLPLSGGNGTPTWPEMKIQEPARVSMRNASLKVGAIGLGRCLRRSMALLPTILRFSPPRRVRAPGRALWPVCSGIAAAAVSPAMAERARGRSGHAPNASVSVEDGQALSFADSSFDIVLCNLGLMFFPDPVRGLSEFRRVLRPGGRVAVSVNTVVERSYNHQINEIIARYRPSLAEAVTRTFALREASRLRSLFDEAGLVDFETDTVRHTFVLPSFDAYYGPFERGGASTGQALEGLPEEIRRAVREEVQRDLADTGGPVEAEAEYRIASALR